MNKRQASNCSFPHQNLDAATVAQHLACSAEAQACLCSDGVAKTWKSACSIQRSVSIITRSAPRGVPDCTIGTHPAHRTGDDPMPRRTPIRTRNQDVPPQPTMTPERKGWLTQWKEQAVGKLPTFAPVQAKVALRHEVERALATYGPEDSAAELTDRTEPGAVRTAGNNSSSASTSWS